MYMEGQSKSTLNRHTLIFSGRGKKKHDWSVVCVHSSFVWPFNIPNVTPTSQPEITMSGGNVVPPLTTHVLDTARGIPGGGISMVLLIQTGNGEFREIERGTTTNDGRGGFLSSSSLQAGAVYKLFFDTDCYFKSIGVKGFYPYVEVVFRIEDPSQHYHVPLLLSPYGYSTYRGS
ncbi:5-hydroxyisourate hydrolase-like isoform X1 [Crassostrea angulata]|uniref:5-hydroxyisourate hydrolase-like isoform X1 n=2 Tax=Magallana angulata TaxID=2784310 RepID=UPI0022B0D7C6|nr:5-hydroxyisourate hydrolase-like isoform X1 [Crassostrea angulata]